MSRTVHVTAHVEPGVREALEGLAREKRQSISRYLEDLIYGHLKLKKRLPAAVARKTARPKSRD